MAATLAAEFLHALLRVNLAAGAAILLVLPLRGIVRPRFGARLSYSLWLLPILAAVAVLVPARQVLIAAPSVLPASLPSPSAAALTALPLETLPTTIADALTGVPLKASASLDLDLLILLLWLAGVVGAGLVMVALQRRFVSEMRNGGIGPAVVGVVRPRIVTPKDFGEKFSDEEQALVLAHEHVHIERQDSRINGLSAAIQCLCWFNPLVHLAARLMRVDQEMACDEVVVTRFPDARRAYAHALVKGQLAVRPLPLGCYWPSAGAHPLYERIAMLKRDGFGRTRRLAGGMALAALCAATGVAAWAAQPADVRIARRQAAPAVAQAMLPKVRPEAAKPIQLAVAAPSLATIAVAAEASEETVRIVPVQAPAAPITQAPTIPPSAEPVISLARADLPPSLQPAALPAPLPASPREAASPAAPAQKITAAGAKPVWSLGGTVQITPPADAVTDGLQRGALLLAARETVAKGYDLFRFSPDGSWAGPATYGYSSGQYRTQRGSFSMPIVKRGRPLTITMIKGPRPDRMPEGMFEARDVLAREGGQQYATNYPADGHPLVETPRLTPADFGFRGPFIQ